MRGTPNQDKNCRSRHPFVSTAQRKSQTFAVPMLVAFGTDKDSLELRQKWVNAIRRENWLEKQIDNARICSSHLITGK